MKLAADRELELRVVVNPGAGGNSTKRRWQVAENLLRAEFPRMTVAFSAEPGDITRQTRAALQAGHPMVLAVGGDGTAHEALNGFVDDQGRNLYPDRCLGILASGTGGDFQRMFGRMRLGDQIKQLAASPPRAIDYGIVRFVDHDGNERTSAFVNIASTGVSASVAREVNANPTAKSSGGGLSYLKSTLAALVRHRPRAVEITIGEHAPRRVAIDLCAVANGQFFGSGMQICPQARIDDGLFEVLEVSVHSRARLVWALQKVFSGGHMRTHGVLARRGDEVRIDVVGDDAAPLWLELDGEQPGRLPARFNLVHRGIYLRIASRGTRAWDLAQDGSGH